MKIDEIAKRAKVSRSTVSRVLNNNPRVNLKTRQLVNHVIQEMNYVPNAAARSLASKRSSVIGVLIYNINQPYWSGIFSGIEQETADKGFSVLLANFRNAHTYIGNRSQSIRNLLLQNVDGIIIALYNSPSEDDLELLRTSGKPFVVIQSSEHSGGFSTVNVDNHLLAYQATEYLIQMGHTNIYHSTGPLGNQIANDRLAGYLQAMQDHKLRVTDDHLISCGSMYDDGYWCMKRVIGRQQLPTAMLFHNDITAYGAIQACREEHIRVPEDLSMIGIDHLASMTDFGSMLPDLTSMTLPITQYGVQAAHLLMDQIENNSPVQNVILPCSLYKGSTVRQL